MIPQYGHKEAHLPNLLKINHWSQQSINKNYGIMEPVSGTSFIG